MAEQLNITADIAIPIDDIDLHAVRSQGAGGQNVNKLATAIHLQFDFEQCSALPDRVKRRLAALDDQRISGTRITIKAQEFRSQSRNREAALERLRRLIADALADPKPRIKTRPSRAAKKKRIDDKRRQGQLKKGRGRIKDD